MKTIIDDQALDKKNIVFKDSISQDSEFFEFTVNFIMLSYDRDEVDPEQNELLIHTRSQVAKDKAKDAQDQ